MTQRSIFTTDRGRRWAFCIRTTTGITRRGSVLLREEPAGGYCRADRLQREPVCQLYLRCVGKSSGHRVQRKQSLVAALYGGRAESLPVPGILLRQRDRVLLP